MPSLKKRPFRIISSHKTVNPNRDINVTYPVCRLDSLHVALWKDLKQVKETLLGKMLISDSGFLHTLGSS